MDIIQTIYLFKYLGVYQNDIQLYSNLTKNAVKP